MENMNSEKNGHKMEDSRHCSKGNMESTENNSLTKSLINNLEPEDLLIYNIRKLHTIDNCSRKLSLQSVCAFGNQIPKHIITLDERYFRCLLEMIRVHSLGAASYNLSSKMSILPDSLSPREIGTRNAFDTASLFIECPLAAGKENYMMTSSGDWILGPVTGSKSMINILKSPLLNQFGNVDCNNYLGKTSLGDVTKPVYSDLISSPGEISGTSSQKQQKELFGYPEHESEQLHKRFGSISSTNSTFSEQSSSSGTIAVSQGMLQGSWKDGLPCYVFSTDDEKEVYVAIVLKVSSPDDKFLDYVYTFYSRSDSKAECKFHEIKSDLVGKMRVSTSLTLSSNHSEILETQFVLFGSNDNCAGEMQASSHAFRKDKGLTKRVVDVFRTRQSYRQRNSLKFAGTSSIFEDVSWVPPKDVGSNLDAGGAGLMESQTLPSLELAAIVVKDPISDRHQKKEVGGWGLKFLKEPGSWHGNTLPETSESYEISARNSGECSTSMDILIPAGFHGGPRTREGGPSSLMERWSSGGRCDCGGWDIGCPLTVLKTRPRQREPLSLEDISGNCKTFDLFTQGSNECAPVMKMTNIHDGLYYIHFQSTLSALQTFGIATAIIHSHSPILRPKVYRN